MNRHAIDVTSLHERASATPGGTDAARGSSRSEPSAPEARAGCAPSSPEKSEALDRSLRATQIWFERAVTSPDGVPGGEAEIDARLTRGPSLSALERLAVYRTAYRARLVECLADDYSVLRHALGAPAFEALCEAYVARHPPRGPSLNFYGRAMEAFVRSDEALLAVPRGFAADLVALEWSIVEVIHAPASEPLTLEGLAGIAPDAWAGARLRPNTALVLRRFDHPVNAYFQAVRDGEAPPVPQPEPSATVVYRSGPSVWRMDLTPPMFEVLSALVASEPLAAALSRAEPHLMGEDPEAVAARVSHWFREWIASGLFVRIDAGS